MDTIQITLYLVGYDEEDAREGLPHDSIESAEEYASNEGGEIYEVTATIDFSTIRKSGE